MSSCEKCWAEAYTRSLGNGKSQTENYNDILAEKIGKACSPKEQAGQFWDEEKQCDRRKKC
jgi:hypothetical protein